MNTATDTSLRVLTAEQLEARFETETDTDTIVALVKEMDRRERAARKAKREQARRDAVRYEYELYQHAEYLLADAVCRGNLLSKEGKRLGWEERWLWAGRESTARKMASEELNEYWDAHGRLTITEFIKSRSADARAARAAAFDADTIHAESVEINIPQQVTTTETEVTETEVITERIPAMTASAPKWTEMDADLFGADTAGVLFDASNLSRKADEFGTPDMFADAEADAGEAANRNIIPISDADDIAAEFETDALALNYITQAASEVLGDRQAAEQVAFTVMANDRVMYAALCYIAESVAWETLTNAVRAVLTVPEVPDLPDLPDAAPIWVRTCNHVGCVLTSKHTHGVTGR